MNKACFIDRDGTLIADKSYLAEPSGVEFLCGVFEGLRVLKSAGLVLAVVTNQSGIGRGYYTAEDMNFVNRYIDDVLQRERIQIDAWYHCPHHPDDVCACRKPMRGMADQAARDLDLDLVHSYVIGDSDADIGLARNIGATGIRVQTGPAHIPCELAADFTADTFDMASRYVVQSVCG